jgi:hypothetical protein
MPLPDTCCVPVGGPSQTQIMLERVQMSCGALR